MGIWVSNPSMRQQLGDLGNRSGPSQSPPARAAAVMNFIIFHQHDNKPNGIQNDDNNSFVSFVYISISIGQRKRKRKRKRNDTGRHDTGHTQALAAIHMAHGTYHMAPGIPRAPERLFSELGERFSFCA